MERIGEVVEASSTGFVAQCYELYRSPPLGSLVKTCDAGCDLCGIVYHAATTSLEPGRRPIARGKDEATEEAVYQSNPQLTRLLSTEFSVLLVGYRQNNIVYQRLPSLPPHIHGFVYLSPPEEVRQFSKSFNFLSTMLTPSLPVPAAEVVAACLRQLSLSHEDRHAFLVAAGRELSRRLSDDFSQLKAILERVIE